MFSCLATIDDITVNALSSFPHMERTVYYGLDVVPIFEEIEITLERIEDEMLNLILRWIDSTWHTDNVSKKNIQIKSQHFQLDLENCTLKSIDSFDNHTHGANCTIRVIPHNVEISYCEILRIIDVNDNLNDFSEGF